MEDNTLVCMNCGHPNIYYLHCKIRCDNCGFTLDCSDLDVGGEVQRAARRTKAEQTPLETKPQPAQNELS
jgi:hypothetical protein